MLEDLSESHSPDQPLSPYVVGSPPSRSVPDSLSGEPSQPAELGVVVVAAQEMEILGLFRRW